MRRPLACLALLAALAVSGCAADSPGATPTGAATPSGGSPYSADVRANFLSSCVENATNSSQDGVTEEQLTQTCECILGKVENAYSEAEFAQFEQRLLGGEAADEESARLVGWSTACAEETSS